jgi:hypothetical protein
METSAFQAAKLFLESATGLSKDAMHIYVELAVFFAAAMAFRKPLSSFLPVAVVVAVAVAGEMLDMRDDLGSLGYWRWQASIHDLINTGVWPFVIWLLARLRFLRIGKDG